MKKTRIFAALLCVMMVCTCIPMLASATTTTWDSIDDILDGAATAELDWDMTSDAYTTGVSFVSRPTTHTADGADLTSGNFRYSPSTSWSPLAGGKALYLQLKVTGTGAIDLTGGTNSIAAFIHAPGTTENNYGFRLNADGIVNPAWVSDKITYNSGFAPGTGYVEYLMLGDTEGNYQLYAKKVEDAAWTLAIEGFGYSPSNSTTYGINITGNTECGAYIKKLAIYNVTQGWDSIDDILGGAATPALNWDMTNADYQNGLSFVYRPTTHTADGADLTSGMLRYSAAASWSPLAEGKALYFQAKATGTGAIEPNGGDNLIAVFVQDPSTTDKTYGFRFNADGFTNPAWVTGIITNNTGFAPGTGYVEYLMVDNNGGFKLYAKRAEDRKWVLAIEGTGHSPVTGTNYGVTINNTANCGGYVKKLATYMVAPTWDSVDDIMGVAATPALDWDMTSADYQTGLTFVLAPPTTHTADGADLATGVIRYSPAASWSPLADGKALYFQAKATGTGAIEANGGTNSIAVFVHDPSTENQTYGFRFNADGFANPAWVSGTITNDTGFAPGTGLVEYLMVDNNGGYKLYAKRAEDAAWTLAIEGSGHSPVTGTNYGVYMTGNTDCSAYIKSIKVYRNTSDDDILTVTDGVSADVLENGGTFTYYGALQAIVTAESGKLMMASYSNNGTKLENVQIFDVALLSDGTASFDANELTGTPDTIKFFLWNDFESLNPVVPAFTLHCAQ